jgi:hypothetical protein
VLAGSTSVRGLSVIVHVFLPRDTCYSFRSENKFLTRQPAERRQRSNSRLSAS